MTPPRRILLQGYYGYANLGDDLLVLVAFRMLRLAFPGARILVRCHSPRGSYLRPFLGGSVSLVSSLEPIDYDLIVAGGGGVFFDFGAGSSARGWLNKGARLVPAPWLAAARQGYRRLKGNRGADAPLRVGIGIGVGSFTPTSPKFLLAKASLGETSLLVVRDEESRQNALQIAPTLAVRRGADLVFARRFWCPEPVARPTNGAPRLTLVLRDWPHDRGAHLPSVVRAVRRLQERGVGVELALFDPEDEPAIAPLFPGVPLRVWRPAEPGALDAMLHHLATSDLVVSTRAHGAIAAGCLRVPSICIAIEPKLRIVAGMFPRSGLSLAPGEDLEENLVAEVLDRLARRDLLRPLVDQDVEDQERTALATIPLLQELVGCPAVAS
ncbi:MAG: polysaccharide pyruvyl transferase family protein [Polyangiaceae bacterium]|jgi:polysaccharide pyruvyl transferase WcaK-like protein|nr:polysaccharide pyruvyl transferase family protein [Polyangiaceae bacterium]